MQTKEITESPFHRKLISGEKVQGCLKEDQQHDNVQAHIFTRKMMQGLQNL